MVEDIDMQAGAGCAPARTAGLADAAGAGLPARVADTPAHIAGGLAADAPGASDDAAAVAREALLDNTLVGMALCVDARYRWVNRKLADMLGSNRDELTGRPAALPPAEDWELAARASEQLRQGLPFSGECQMRRGNGRLITVEVFGQAVHAGAPERGVMWTVLDVTERRKAEEETRQALRRHQELDDLRARFIAMASHEFRTPLSSILSSAELLKYYGDKLPAGEKRELVEGIETAVKRIARLLDEVLLIGRADSDTPHRRASPVNLSALCRELVDEARRAEPAAHPHRFELDVGCTCEAHALDEHLLRHILSNLLSNAVKYSPAGSVVSLHAQCRGHEVELVVADHGIGVPASELPRVFETFYRASNTGGIAGAGLGLAAVRKSVELHGGTIRAESGPHSGTRFIVVLPCAHPA